jgi:hypothetical protein
MARQKRDLDVSRRPAACDGQFFVPVECDPDRGFGSLGKLDRDDGLIAECGLRAESAANMFGDDLNLAGIELEPFGDLTWTLCSMRSPLLERSYRFLFVISQKVD